MWVIHWTSRIEGGGWGNEKWKAKKIEISREIIISNEIWIVEGVKSN